MDRRIFWRILVCGFGLNLIWEFAHSSFYIHGWSSLVFPFILVGAALFDGVVIVLFAAIFKRSGLVFLSGILLAVIIEKIALFFGWWGYNSLMPTVPLLNTGLTPTVQLGFLGYLSIKLASIKKMKKILTALFLAVLFTVSVWAGYFYWGNLCGADPTIKLALFIK